MTDDGGERLAAQLGRIEGPARWFQGVVTGAAVLAGVAALLLWWAVASDDVVDWWRGTVLAAVGLLLLGLPALWLVNVRLALGALVELPATVGDVARRRGGELRDRRPARPRGGLVGTMRLLHAVVADYQSVVGGWALVAQLVAPSFWLVTGIALVSVPVLWLLALGAVAISVV